MKSHVDRATRERPTWRVIGPLLTTFGLVAAMLGSVAPAAAEVLNTCRARNLTQGTPSHSNLQAVITAASPGDKIAVKFVCVGNFHIAKKLTLIGRSAGDLPGPVLHAGGRGRVLVVSAPARLTGLVITGGHGGDDAGGGIHNTDKLTLTDVSVRGNSARSGAGGIYNDGGTLILKGSSSVKGNRTRNSGGGIYNYQGTIILQGSSSIHGNTARASGGGIANFGTVTLNDLSTVRGNTAIEGGGGGVFNAGPFTLNDSSTVRGNSAGSFGGGIDDFSVGGTVTLNDSSTVRRNTADADDVGGETGGGIFVGCGATLIGAIEGGNVSHNHRSTSPPVEDNVDEETGCT